MKREATLQSECFKWFRLQFPHLRWLLFAIPNGGSRNIAEAANLKRQGVVAGVADTFLAVPNKHHHGLFIEFKIGTNKLTDKQGEFSWEVKNQGYEYAICREFDDFHALINGYLRK